MPTSALALADLEAGGNKELFSFAKSTVKPPLKPAESTRHTEAFLPALPFHWLGSQSG